MKISKGRLRKPLRAVLYGVEGIGKTTLSSQFPKPIFLDTEGSTVQLDVDRVPNPLDENDPVLRKWTDLIGAMLELAKDSHGYQTVIVDSIDWAEQLAVKQIESEQKKHPDDIPYGRGPGMISDKIRLLLNHCDSLVAAGLNVLLVGHSTVKRCSPPDMDEGFDRHELKLRPKTAPLVKEWCDALLFCNYKTRVVEGDDGKNRGRGGKERIICAERSAAWDAKNRFGLGETIPMTIDALAPLFTAAKPAAPAEPDVPLFDRIADYIGKAASVRTLGTIGDKVDGYVSTGELTPVQEQLLRDAIAERHNEIEPAEANA